MIAGNKQVSDYRGKEGEAMTGTDAGVTPRQITMSTPQEVRHG